jgi:RNA polymerase sigma-70 factor (ECF subfamily)
MEFEELYKTYWQKIFRLCMGYVMIMTLRRTLLRKHLLLFGKNWKHLEMNPALGLGFSE